MHYLIDLLTWVGGFSVPIGGYLAHRKLKAARSVLKQMQATRNGYAGTKTMPTSQYTIPTERPHR